MTYVFFGGGGGEGERGWGAGGRGGGRNYNTIVLSSCLLFANGNPIINNLI